MPGPLDNPILDFPLPPRIGPLKPNMLIFPIGPIPKLPVLPHAQSLNIFNSIGKGDNIIPISREQMYSDCSLRDKTSVLVHTSCLVFLIQIVDCLIAWGYFLVPAAELVYVYLEVVLEAFQVLAFADQVVVLHFFVLVARQCGQSSVFKDLACRLFVTSSIDIMEICLSKQIVISPQEKCTAGRSNITLTGNLPILIQSRIDKIMREHKIDLAFLQPIVHQIHDPIPHQNPFQPYLSLRIKIVRVDPESKIGDELACVALACQVEGFGLEGGKFVRQEAEETIEVVFSHVGVVVDVRDIAVETVSDSWWRIDKEDIGKTIPGVRIWRQCHSRIVGDPRRQQEWANLHQETQLGCTAWLTTDPERKRVIISLTILTLQEHIVQTDIIPTPDIPGKDPRSTRPIPRH